MRVGVPVREAVSQYDLIMPEMSSRTITTPSLSPLCAAGFSVVGVPYSPSRGGLADRDRAHPLVQGRFPAPR